MSHNMSNDMSDEVYEFFNECQIVVKIKDIREKNKQLDELEQQLKELPKKICDEIEKFTYDTYKEFGAFDATDLQHILDEIRKKYTKEQKMREKNTQRSKR